MSAAAVVIILRPKPNVITTGNQQASVTATMVESAFPNHDAQVFYEDALSDAMFAIDELMIASE